jgi:hypothetical protein
VGETTRQQFCVDTSLRQLSLPSLFVFHCSIFSCSFLCILLLPPLLLFLSHTVGIVRYARSRITNRTNDKDSDELMRERILVYIKNRKKIEKRTNLPSERELDKCVPSRAKPVYKFRERYRGRLILPFDRLLRIARSKFHNLRRREQTQAAS